MYVSPDELLCEYLKGKGVGANAEANPTGDAPQWSIYLGSRPDGPGVPDDIISIRDTHGRQDGKLQDTGDSVNHPGFQITVRSTSKPAAYDKAMQICVALDQIAQNDVGFGDAVDKISSTSRGDPLYMGAEPGNRMRHVYAVNGIATIGLFIIIP